MKTLDDMLRELLAADTGADTGALLRELAAGAIGGDVPRLDHRQMSKLLLTTLITAEDAIKVADLCQNSDKSLDTDRVVATEVAREAGVDEIRVQRARRVLRETLAAELAKGDEEHGE